MKSYLIRITKNDAIALSVTLKLVAEILTDRDASPAPKELTKLMGEHPVTSLLRVKARIDGQLERDGFTTC